MRVTTKGQVTIPSDIRRRLGIRAGSEVQFVERDEAVVLEMVPDSGTAEDLTFEQWADGVAGTIDTDGLDGRAYIDMLRGPRDDGDTR